VKWRHARSEACSKLLDMQHRCASANVDLRHGAETEPSFALVRWAARMVEGCKVTKIRIPDGAVELRWLPGTGDTQSTWRYFWTFGTSNLPHTKHNPALVLRWPINGGAHDLLGWRWTVSSAAVLQSGLTLQEPTSAYLGVHGV
jgi:hypothetical protein